MASQNNYGNLTAYKTDGTAIAPSTAAGTMGCTLANSTTYYIPIAPFIAEKDIVSLHLQWAAAVAGTFTIEVSNFQAGHANGAADVTDYSTTTGEWVPWNSAAYVPVVGTGNSATAATITAGGTNAGAAVIELGAFASRRLRIKAVITTGGLARFGCFGKEQSRT